MTYTFKLSRRTAGFRAAALTLLLAAASACDSTDPVAPSAIEPALQPSLSVTSSSISISNISVRSGKSYRVAWGLAAGAKHYIDRSYTFVTPIPSAAQGLAYILTANDDKDAYPGSTSFLSFDISTDAIVYVGHDDRLSRPAWLTSNFKDTGLDLPSSDPSTKFSLFKRSFQAGRVTLGSNVTTAAKRSMYVVLVEPVATAEAVSTTTETATVTSTGTGTGIPFGHFHLPNTQFGSLYDGAVRNIWPAYLVSNLSAIKARGGKVMVSFTGSQNNVKDANGNFSFSKWKSLVDRYRTINFASYIKDGTIIAHYLIDEPNDKADWNGTAISPATVEAMAKYSKSIWPGMPTIVRTWPTYMKNYSGTYYHLDAAWIQYVARKGSVSTVLSTEVSAAKSKGLAVIVGLNILKGGYNGARMTPSEIKSWGSTLLADPYSCGFVSWQYNSDYLSRSDVKSAMAYLRDKAKSRSFKTCRGA